MRKVPSVVKTVMLESNASFLFSYENRYLIARI
jgi:hypothetical protein